LFGGAFPLVGEKKKENGGGKGGEKVFVQERRKREGEVPWSKKG